ncbi:ABC transporter ATP-binding protein [Bacillus sp. EB106-08-02-XG196]|uniref:ABC transporter ATP-binding protein n=1 Tax=Bacillus sp. EB106-08-02-XG196 TaxID=2737049 RepID=UPI0015C4A3D0|nr:ABC transporter ATP-binding protein [Bacillus sp. EB106-08-02-XG196]NWQ40477.1 ABC transporter ATP-binding protein [Bacillus sp. EB106-08-02-XG196]
MEDSFVQQIYNKNQKNSFKVLVGLYKGNYLRIFYSAVFFIIKHIPAWVMPIVIANVINAATIQEGGGIQTIYLNAIIMFILVLQNIVTNYYHTKLHSYAIRSVESGLRASLIKKLQELSIPYQKEMQSGRLQSKIMRDVEAVQTLSSQVFVSSLNIIVNLLLALAITLYNSPTVFLFFILTVPISALIIVVFRKKIRTSNSEFRQEMEETSARVIEMIELVPIARAHALEKQEVRRLNHRFQQILTKGFQLDIIQSVFGSVSWASFQLFQIICLVFTGILALRGSITPGEVVMYQTYFTTVVNSVSSMITLIPTIAKGLESVNSIGEILTAGEVENHENKPKIKQVDGNFSLQQICYRYPNSDQTILQDINLEVKQGETVAFVGESGSGKSTILNLLIGFIQPTDGKILLDGHDMSFIDLRSFRQHLAVVPQSTILFSGTILQNITYGMPSVTDEELQRVLLAANLWDVIQKLPEGLNTRIGEHGDKLSGGQRQRVSIARALIRNPKVIILDEATSALDSHSEKKIQEALNSLCHGRTTFIVAHRLSTIRNADKIAMIENGRCVEFGTYEELMSNRGKFYELKQLQI